jgi:hypothetical protein
VPVKERSFERHKGYYMRVAGRSIALFRKQIRLR